jgi:hypothetical protein
MMVVSRYSARPVSHLSLANHEARGALTVSGNSALGSIILGLDSCAPALGLARAFAKAVNA